MTTIASHSSINDQHPTDSTSESPRVTVGSDVCPSPHSWKNKVGRVLWGIVSALLFRPSPRMLNSWRRTLLRSFGARIGSNARIHPSVRIWAPWNLNVGDEASIGPGADCYCVDTITIGHHATVSQEAMICTASHDITDPHLKLITAPIVISSQAWVCARAFVMPGVTIAEGAVAAAQAVVTRDVPAWHVVAGNPAVFIKTREIKSHG